MADRTLAVLRLSDGSSFQWPSSIANCTAIKSGHPMSKEKEEKEIQIDGAYGGPFGFFHFSEVMANDHLKLGAVFRHRSDIMSAIPLA